MLGYTPLLAATLAASAGLVQAVTYTIEDTFIGSSFYSGFTAQAIPDPTAGRVNYVSQSQAQSLNLTYASSDSFILRTDYTTVLSASGPGRNSVRLSSNKQYSNSLVVANIRHMPQGCGTWPALWSFGSNWPYDGEIDILEGVNDHSPNQATLHTGPGCTMAASRTQTGTITSNDCNTADNGNAGCGVLSPDTKSYGPAFNSNGGGWYAMERTSTSISVWFWERTATNVPSAISSGAGTADSSTFGEPFALFTNAQCDIPSNFGAHNIIINLTLCGQWAGQTAIYNGDGCPGDCVSNVNSNPSSFVNAYFDFASLRVYQPSTGSATTTTTSKTSTTTTKAATSTTTTKTTSTTTAGSSTATGKCNGVSYTSSQVCDNGHVCPSGQYYCGSACYNPSTSCCSAGAIVATSSTGCKCGSSGQVYSPTSYVCDNASLCPLGTYSCGGACYNPSSYGCCNGGLTPAGQGC